jgi:DNA modification methylase
MTPYYEHAGITIYHGNYKEVLPRLPKVDLLLTDPPYGIGADVRQSARANKQHGKAATVSHGYGVTDWDSAPPTEAEFGLLLTVAKWQIVWGGNYFGLPASRCWLVWDKDNGKNKYADCELAWTNLERAVRLFRFRWMGMLQEDMAHKEYRDHPTQKPVPIMRWAISLAPNDCAMVCDPFMGSGTTLVAAKQLGRRAIGIEIEERYCAMAAKRLSQEVFEFDEPAPHPATARDSGGTGG